MLFIQIKHSAVDTFTSKITVQNVFLLLTLLTLSRNKQLILHFVHCVSTDHLQDSPVQNDIPSLKCNHSISFKFIELSIPKNLFTAGIKEHKKHRSVLTYPKTYDEKGGCVQREWECTYCDALEGELSFVCLFLEWTRLSIY